MTEKELMAMPPLTFPCHQLTLARGDKDQLKVFDPLREKFVLLTPEEYVRQNFVRWMIDALGYPKSHLANEVEIKLNSTKKRCDTVAYGRYCEPLIIVEYKAPSVDITQDTFDQIVRYNRELKARYLVVTNGLRVYCCIIDYDRDSYNFIRLVPHYNDAAGMPGVN